MPSYESYEKRRARRAARKKAWRAARFAATAAVLALPAAALATDSAEAASSCTVNGQPVSGSDIRGTEGNDTITCAAGVTADTVVDALGGDDTVVVGGQVAGRVRGGDGNDRIILDEGSTLTGDIDGQAGTDTLDLKGPVSGAVRGGQGDDTIHLFPHARVESGGDIRGALGADTITADDDVDVLGLVEGNDQDDTVDIKGTVGPGGRVHGDAGDDDLHARLNNGTVDGGDGNDRCVVDDGALPINCERPARPLG
ncbi:hypothetical protein GCM10010218_42580 [Streptomyces mashuensis]|uniref:Uncharacterized protein n=1 Tax=Streptomyces mashuensis TaxID=33904 RepID=A0A919B6Q2_9ACTN|nr:hypothetical protein [Streptomyces mashuensis]GHF56714.1 hypothetical protein GCM10010218_42580 [Streptomyces mashuensis]